MAGDRTIGCVLVNHFRARVELARRPQLSDCAGMIVDRSRRRSMVVDTLPAIREAVAGMRLERARSLVPNAVVLEADEPYYRQAFEELLCALDLVSDRVEGAELGVAYVGLDGASVMSDELLCAMPEHYKPRIGIGANKFTSFVAARVRRSSGVTMVPADAAAFLAPHPIELLPCSSDLIDDLEQLGLRSLGDIAAQEPHALLDRFGREGRRAWELANGIDERPLRPWRREEPVVETLLLPEASVSLELLRVVIERLLERAYAQPRMRGRYAETATLTCALEDAPTWEKAFHFRTGVGSWRRAAEMIKRRLETEYPQAPIETITITLAQLGGATGEQGSLFPDLRHDRERRLLETERKLQARLNGQRSLRRLVEVAPWHPAPELRTVHVSIDPSADDGLRPLTAPTAIAVREGPEREPLAVRIGEDWRTVARIEDQWSFNLWWRLTPMQRRYYQVSGEDGRQLTLYRDGEDQCWYRQTA